MANVISKNFNLLEVDTWRRQNPFSDDVEHVQDKIFLAEATDEQITSTLRDWLQRYQPCVFGVIAAKLDLIGFCILRESDLLQSDEFIREKILSARLATSDQALKGQKSAFVLLVVSPRIAYALPGPPVLEIAKRIGFLYLNEEIKVDTIHMDRFYLEQPSKQREIWWYYAGVNYFSAQGDGRWWQDHRMPGGLAYSVNSVAHLVKSGNIARSIEEILKDHRLLLDTGWTKTKIESLPKALEFAMRTISNAADAVSGKATQLLTYDEDQNCDAARCPIELTGKLKGMSYCHYRGYYHTDHTLPSSYFMPDVKRPNDIHTFELDFTYLYDEGLHNPEHFTMGKGMRIRHGRHSLDREHESRFLKGISNLASEAEYYGWVSEIQSRIGKPESSN